MSDVVVYEDKAPVKRKQGQQPKWETWVKKMDEVLNRNHPVGYAIVYNDEMLLAVVNSELPEEDRISKRTFNYYKSEGHIEDGSIASVFVATYQKALSIQELASQTVSLQPNTTRNVAELEHAGLVERSIGDDRRVVNVQVTPKGMELVSEVQKYLQEFHMFQYQSLSNAERYLLDELLLKIAHLPDDK